MTRRGGQRGWSASSLPNPAGVPSEESLPSPAWPDHHRRADRDPLASGFAGHRRRSADRGDEGLPGVDSHRPELVQVADAIDDLTGRSVRGHLRRQLCQRLTGLDLHHRQLLGNRPQPPPVRRC